MKVFVACASRHQRARASKLLESPSKNISFEEANLDVIDFENGIVIECGHTSPRKLLDSFNGVFTNIKEINEFIILQFYDETDYNSFYYKFIKSKSYK